MYDLLLWAILEDIAKPNVHIYGVHGKGDGVEIAFEDVVKAVGEVGINREMLESTPRTAHLKAPKPASKVGREVVGSRLSIGETNLFAHGRPATQIAFANETREFAIHSIRCIQACAQLPAIAQLVCT